MECGLSMEENGIHYVCATEETEPSGWSALIYFERASDFEKSVAKVIRHRLAGRFLDKEAALAQASIAATKLIEDNKVF